MISITVGNLGGWIRIPPFVVQANNGTIIKKLNTVNCIENAQALTARFQKLYISFETTVSAMEVT